MRILALELSTSRGNIASVDEDGEVLFREFPNDPKHSGAFFDNLRFVLDQGAQPGSIVVGLGPGSYAGVRIAIATATGLSAAYGASVFGVPSICGIDTNVPEYAVIGDARRQAFFFAQIASGRCVEGPALFDESALHDRLSAFAHPVFTSQVLPTFPEAAIAFPSASILAQLPPAPAQVNPLEPLYLREPHITLARKTSTLTTTK